MAYHKFNLLLHDNMHISHQITVKQYIILILCVKHVFVYLYLRCHLLILSLFTLYYSVKYCSFVHMKWNVVLYGLLFSGLGVFSYLLLANYSELPPQVSDILYSKGAFIFFISALFHPATQFMVKQPVRTEPSQTLENHHYLYSCNSSILFTQLQFIDYRKAFSGFL